MAMSGREKATILLSVLGADVSDKILARLPAEVADEIVSGLDRLPTPSSEAVAEILDEGKNFIEPGSVPQSKPVVLQEKVHPEIVSAVEQRGTALLPPENIKPSSLEEVPAAQMASMLLEERPQLIAFILSKFLAEKKLEVLHYLSGEHGQIEKLISNISDNAFSKDLYQELHNFYMAKI